jgi:signal transduction histidine kinase/DNA-binding NarL/FixJ family response regulator
VEGLPSEHATEDEDVLDDRTLVVLDVSKNKRFKNHQILNAFSDIKFYAAVPIISPRGYTIGAYSIMDTDERDSIPDQHDLQFMKDMAGTIMEHLAVEQSALKNYQAERMIVGLGSFVEGRTTLRDSWREANAQYAASEQSGETIEGQLNIQQQHLQEYALKNDKKDLAFRDASEKDKDVSNSESNGPRPQQDSNSKSKVEVEDNTVRSVLAGETLQDDSLPSGIRQVCSRAANLIRESIGAEGVMFLDANSERFGSLVKQNHRKVSGPTSKELTSSGDESTDSASSSKRHKADSDRESESENPLVSECLGYSSSRMSSINDGPRAGQHVVVPEPFFTSLIRRYPRGKIFTYDANGFVSEDSEARSIGPDSNLIARANQDDKGRPRGKKRRKPHFKEDADNLIKIFAHARNILLLPIWDSDKGRCFAGTLVWTNDPGHIFTTENELVYISAFTNSIMAEIRRLDVEIAEKAKTNLVSSITHELRNPLHAILGTADILSDTAMNALQHGMVHTIESCGRTLLDTINNLLDLTFIDKYQKKIPRSKRNHRKNQQALPADSKNTNGGPTAGRGRNVSYTQVELDSVLEEVADCVFAGYSFYTHPQAPPPALTGDSSRWAGPTSKSDTVGPRASQVTIIFDIQPDTEWDFYTHAGAWRRILMNVFGNALKYTPSGYIYLGLKSEQRKSESTGENAEFEVTLTVKDTGKGIGPQYLQNDVFTPFTQEDPLASGSGLGLSIVRQAVGFLSGSIEIESTQGVGTTLSIRTPLTRSSGPSETSSSDSKFSSLQHYTQEKTIGLLGFGSSLHSQRDTSLYSSLERLCCDWFGLKVSNVSPIKGENFLFDFYLAVQTELDSEDTEGRNLFALASQLAYKDGCRSPVVVICQSPEEAHKLFVAAKNRDQTAFFEFISQPCGPRKLARALNICIKRQIDDETGRPSEEEPTHWVEMPESSHLPMDLGAVDPPKERMKISKRPTADTMSSPTKEYSEVSLKDQPQQSQQQNTNHTQNPTQKAEQDIQADSSGLTVLLVDDNDLNLQLLCAFTKKCGRNYVTAKNGAEAVELYKADPGKYQVIILGMSLVPFLAFQCRSCVYTPTFDNTLTVPDISMPIMDGFEASRQIRRSEKEFRAGLTEEAQKSLPNTIIAALTGLDSPNAQKEAFGSGIDTFLIKPVKRGDVQAILERTKT